MASEIDPRFEFASELASTTDDVIEAWLRGRNERTRRGYLSDLKQFAIWAGAPSPESAVDALMRHGPGKANQVMLAYRAAMKEPTTENPKGLSSSAINRRLAAIRSMIKYGRLIGVIAWAIDVENEPTREAQGYERPGPGRYPVAIPGVVAGRRWQCGAARPRYPGHVVRSRVATRGAVRPRTGRC